MFSKHFHLCFFKLKYPTTPHPLPNHSSSSQHSPSTSTTDDFFSSSSDSDAWDDPPPPDFASVFASQRFFFSSPGLSNSIVDSHTRPPTATAITSSSVPGVGVPKYSLNPYLDFRRSMQEMIESRPVVVDVSKDWDYLHDLLLCYLALNPSHTHSYIVRAFTDLVIHLLSSSPPPDATFNTRRRHKSFSGRFL